MTYNKYMEIIETPIFADCIVDLISDDSYHKLQIELIKRPESGDLIQGSGGLRKIRWRLPGKGKSGGIRVIYYFDAPSTIYMLLVFRKNSQADLTQTQLKYLKNLIREWIA
jgi:hypothetical protein